MDNDNILLRLLLAFAPMSLMTIGGGISIIGDIQSVVVQNGWFTPDGFINIFGISRASPGPGTLIVTLIGWHVAGFAGAVVASIAIFLPSSLLILVLARLWHSRPPAVWQQAVALGLAPIAAGLVMSSSAILLQASPDRLASWLVALMIFLLSMKTRLGTLTLLAIGALYFILLEPLVPQI
ncbi:MAG: chromate transporter [Rhizobiaceae bacterium]|nr:chromate transporter [Rhizobiaceae bacterium]